MYFNVTLNCIWLDGLLHMSVRFPATYLPYLPTLSRCTIIPGHIFSAWWWRCGVDQNQDQSRWLYIHTSDPVENNFWLCLCLIVRILDMVNHSVERAQLSRMFFLYDNIDMTCLKYRYTAHRPRVPDKNILSLLTLFSRK